jgi:hypothetical protein
MATAAVAPSAAATIARTLLGTGGYRVVLGALAAQGRREAGAHDLAGVEEESVTRQGPTLGKDDTPQRLVPLQTHDACLPQRDAVAPQPSSVRTGDRAAVATGRHPFRPGAQRQGQVDCRFSVAERNQPPVAVLPGVAVRAVMHPAAVESAEAFDGRQHVRHAGGQQELPGAPYGATLQSHCKRRRPAVAIAGGHTADGNYKNCTP